MKMRSVFFLLTVFALLSLTRRGTWAAPLSTIVVNTNADETMPADGKCSLREAINNSNSNSDITSGDCAPGAGADNIVFNIGSGGIQTIDVGLGASALPDITDPVTIDGTTQPGCTNYPCVELNGAGVTTGNGLTIAAGSTVVRGLVINQFPDSGIRIVTNGGDVVKGNYIGTDISGSVARKNSTGIYIYNVSNNTIGGTTTADRNLISGNGSGVIIDGNNFSGGVTYANVVEGNYIGTDATGTAALANTNYGVSIMAAAHNNTIGGALASARNLISGNMQAGINIEGNSTESNVVQGNYIGTDSTGTISIANGYGVLIQNDAQDNTIGGTTAAARNLISGNAEGVVLSGTNTQNNVVEGNYIGTNAAGTAALGNGDGVYFPFGAHNNLIGGTTASARNIISGNLIYGIDLFQGTGNHIQGNYIGTDVTGTAALGNGEDGIVVNSSDNTIGGASAAARNLISGNRLNGVRIAPGYGSGPDTTGNLVQGNYIGTDVSGTHALGNGNNGILIANGTFPYGTINATNNTVGGTGNGAANLIAFNADRGVVVGHDTADLSTGNAILGNSIHGNGNLGIDLANDGTTPNDYGDADAGPNHSQNFPALSSATSTSSGTRIKGSLKSTSSTTFRLEFFVSGGCDSSNHGEGRRFLGFKTVTTASTGNVSFLFTTGWVVGVGKYVTATATDPNNNTSEFSPCRNVSAG